MARLEKDDKKHREDHVRGLRWLRSRLNITLHVIETNNRTLSTGISLYHFIIKGFFSIRSPQLFSVMAESGNYLGGNWEPRTQQRILMIGSYTYNQFENKTDPV